MTNIQPAAYSMTNRIHASSRHMCTLQSANHCYFKLKINMIKMFLFIGHHGVGSCAFWEALLQMDWDDIWLPAACPSVWVTHTSDCCSMRYFYPQACSSICSTSTCFMMLICETPGTLAISTSAESTKTCASSCFRSFQNNLHLKMIYFHSSNLNPKCVITELLLSKLLPSVSSFNFKGTQCNVVSPKNKHFYLC